MECWGQNDTGQGPATVTAAAGTFAQVAAGFKHTCAMRSDGVVECWGNSPYGPTPGQKLPATGTFTQLSSGDYHTCALRSDGAAQCWGDNFYGQAPASKTAASGTFMEVSARGDHTCATRTDGEVECWGKNVSGQAPGSRSATIGSLVQVGSGEDHACAVRADGVVECWGANGSGQAPAIKAAVSGAFTQVSGGRMHSCALRADGVVECWGDPALAPPSKSAPATRTGGYADLDAGYVHGCALRPGGVVECWGDNGYGQAPAPRAASAGGLFMQVSAGYYHTCALRTDGTAECWGNSTYGRAPVAWAAAGGGPFTQISGGGSHTCALRKDGVVECVGYNLDDGRAPPMKAPASGRFTQVSAGGFHACALRSDGVVECWGRDNFAEAPAVRAAAGGKPFTQVSSGEAHTCAVRGDGVVECWGWNDDGQALAVRAPTGGGVFVQVAAGPRHTCALRGDGVVECWGTNVNGEAPATRSTANGTAYTRVTVGASFSCGLRLDGAVECWGYNQDGRAPMVQGPTNDPAHVLPMATLGAPTSAAAGTSFALSLSGAQVPGHPETVAFAYAFDCGDGSGYAPRTNMPNATCLAASVAGAQTVHGRVYDPDSDSSEYGATVMVTAACRAAPSGIVSLWRADGDGADLVGSNPATLGNGVSFAGGYVGNAFAFDGLDDWAVVGNPANLKLTSALTIEAWIKPTFVQSTGQQAYRVIASKWGQATWTDSYWFALDMTTSTIKIVSVLNQVTAGGGTSYLSAVGGALPSGEWSHVAMTFDAGSGILDLYVNGQLVASVTRPGALFTSDVSVVIGGEAVGSTFRPFPGLIDELTVYKRALSAQEIAGVAATGPGGKCAPPPGPPEPSAQRITFTTSAPSPAYVGTTYKVGATASSGLDVSFSSLTASTCTIASNVVSLTATGTCAVAADQAGSADYQAAPQTTQVLDIVKQPQTITFGASPPNPAYVGAAYAVTAQASSGLAVALSVLTPTTCTLASRVVSFIAAGPCTIQGVQGGTATYDTAVPVTQAFSIVKRSQAITFTSAPPSPGTVGSAYVVTAAAGGSGNAVVITSLTSGVCKITLSKGTTKVAFQTLGTCVVAADQAGDATYLAAPEQTQTIRVVWPFAGFLSPLLNPPGENTATAGAGTGVALGFSLSGDRGLAVLASGAPTSAAYVCGTSGPLAGAAETAVAATSSLAYSTTAGNYTYAWKTEKVWSGSCRAFIMRLGDGTTHIALFRFR